MSVRIRSSSVGAHPRPKPVLVSRAGSNVPVATEVRCGCQFFQSDSLLPDRINPVGQSRPESSVDYYVETISRPISPISVNDPNYDSDPHFARPGSRISNHSHVEIIRPEPIIISGPFHRDSPTSFRPIQERPLRIPSTQNNYNMEDTQQFARVVVDPHLVRETTPVRPSLIGKDRLSDRHINVSSQILRNRSRSTSLHGADNVGKIVKTVSFEFGGPDGPDQYRSPYAEHDLTKRSITGSVTNNNNGGSASAAIGNKSSAHSFVKFERKDRSSQDRYFNNDRYNNSDFFIYLIDYNGDQFFISPSNRLLPLPLLLVITSTSQSVRRSTTTANPPLRSLSRLVSLFPHQKRTAPVVMRKRSRSASRTFRMRLRIGTLLSPRQQRALARTAT